MTRFVRSLTSRTVRPRELVRLFFGLLLLLGLAIFADYGVSWDEPADRINGLVSACYVADLAAPRWAARLLWLQQTQPFAVFLEKDHGVLFELPLAFYDQLRPSTDSRTYYLVRHLCTFLVSMAGTWALYRIGRRRFEDWRLGLLTAGALVLSPRFFAESFYNAKDIVFMALFTLAFFTLTRLLARPTWRRALLHGAATAAAIDVRVLGLLLVPLTLGALALEALFDPAADPAHRRRLAGSAGLYLGAAALATVAGWPYLWSAPWTNLRQAFDNMSHFRWVGQVLYLGTREWSTQLPWHYLPVWIAVTTPVVYLLAAATGILGLLGALLRRPLALLRTAAGRLDLLLLGWLLGPLLLVIGLKSVVYDGWRHLYFVYPALLLLGVRGVMVLHTAARATPARRRLGRLAAGLALLAVAHTAWRMVRLHPQQQVYFSFLSPAQAERLFERDYWGLSYRQALERLLAQQPQGRIRVSGEHNVLVSNNFLILTPAQQSRLSLGDTSPGSFLLSSYRPPPGPYRDSTGREVFSLQPGGLRILSVFERP